MTATPDVVSYYGRGIFAIGFLIAVAIIARILSSYGRRFLDYTFKSADAIVQPVHVLLNLGFYLLCIGLFLWNLGIGGLNYSRENIYSQLIEEAALRLGVSLFVVGAFHSMNILVLAILNRKNS
jgi:hypothetical protein